ncbi:MAG: hypothetical protein ACXVC6_03475 [Bacteroidia bacterium]
MNISNFIIAFLVFSVFGFSQTKNTIDTFNIVDAAGKKQGHCIILGKSKPQSCYKPEQIAEEGNYKDNKKQVFGPPIFAMGR